MEGKLESQVVENADESLTKDSSSQSNAEESK